MSTAIRKLDPRYSMYLRGFDRRGAGAALTAATANSFKISGNWADQADFSVLVLHDSDDVFGHLYTTKYLPDSDLSGMVLDFDMALTGCQSPASYKFQSVPWGQLSWIKDETSVDGTVNTSGTAVTWVSGTDFTNIQPLSTVIIAGVIYSVATVTDTHHLVLSSSAGTSTGVNYVTLSGTISLQNCITTITGKVPASRTYTVNGTPSASDRAMLVYLGNQVFDVLYPSGTATVSLGFFNYLGTGFDHTITITNSTNSTTNTYHHIQLAGDGSGDLAIALAAAVNAGSGDPNATATVSANNVILAPRLNDGTSASCTCSDGDSGVLVEITATGVNWAAAKFASIINTWNWATQHLTTSLLATYSGATFTVYAAVAGIVNTSGTGVTWVSGQNFLTCRNGDPIIIDGSQYTISTVNSSTSITLTASAGTLTAKQFTAPGGGTDGNGIELFELHKNANLYVTPANGSKLTGGSDGTSVHVSVDFTARTIDKVRQMWITFAPGFTYDSTSNNTALVAYAGVDFSVTVTNWTVVDPGTKRPLSVAGPGSTITKSDDVAVRYSGFASGTAGVKGNWNLTSGFYVDGYAKVSSTITDELLFKYSCQHVHDLYLGTSLYVDRGIFLVWIDGVAVNDLDTYLNVASPLQTRRKLATSVAAGKHTVKLRIKSTYNTNSSGTTCVFDYVHAVVPGNVLSPATTYSNVGVAFDFDTDQTYKLSPQRSLFIARMSGLIGDVDFYAGVFFALKRVRSGGTFHSATVTLSGTIGYGNSFGGGGADTLWLTVGGTFPNSGTTISGSTTKGGNPTGGASLGGTVIGVVAYPSDTLTSLAQRMVDAINATFSGIRAEPTGTAGQFKITVLSPINGFALDLAMSSGATTVLAVTGDIGTVKLVGGQEGTWQIDSTQTSPLNKGFVDYLTDYCAELMAQSLTTTVAWSQELLHPPDVNTSAGAWSQRYLDGTPVLTSTGFGSWGGGYIESISGGVNVTQTGHGYITGNIVHLASATKSGSWYISVSGVDNYTLSTLIQKDVGYTPAANDLAFIELQTTQCAFSPLTFTPYMSDVFKQTAGIMAASGLTPWLQLGEVGHWFFSRTMSLTIAGFANSSGLVKVQTSAAHNFLTGYTAILAGTGIVDGTQTITVIDATHFTVDGSVWPGGSPKVRGTVSGGGMAYYDANQDAAAVLAIGHGLWPFYTQDDDPTVEASADTDFLAARVKAHTDAIISYTKAAHATSKFEVLWPNDVNFSPCYYTNDFPYPQGGRMNLAVNLPTGWKTKSGSNFDRFKIEALSWGSFYRNINNAKKTITFPFTDISWSEADMVYLIPWFNGGCPWPSELLYAVSKSIPQLCFWAFDHLTLMSWPMPLPIVSGSATLTEYGVP